MSYDLLYTGSTDDEQAYVAWLMMLLGQARTRRLTFEVQWEEAAAMCWPEYRNSFAYGHVRPPGQKYTEFQLDSTGSIASHRFMSICDALMTPFSMCWSIISADNKDLMKDRDVRKYYQQVTEALWKQRYRWEANFFSQNQLNWQALGVFGNAGMMVEELDTKPGGSRPGLRYTATSPGEMYPLENWQGRTDGFIRHFRWNARQAMQRWGDKCGQNIKTAYERNDMQKWDFLQFCLPNTEQDLDAIFSWRGKAYASVYVCVADYCILERGGYRSFPWPRAGYGRAPEEDYDRGPAQMVLPELKTLNAEKGMFLRQGHKAAEPSYLIADDGLVTLKTAPNSFNYGGLSEQGAELAKPLQTGQIQVTQEMMADSKATVNDAFLVNLFPLVSSLDDKGAQKSFLNMIEEANQRGIFLAPGLGKNYSGYLGPMIERELDILSFLSAGMPDDRRILPKLPPILKEAAGEYTTVFCSPLARALSGQKVAGYMKAVGFAQEVAQATGDVSVMDAFDFEVALPAIADEFFVPLDWMAPPDKVAAKKQARAQAQAQDAAVKALPGQAAMAKAAAIQTKAATGGNIGGTLSGVPEGGMPMMPGQSAPGGRAFGQPGQQ